MFSNNLTKKHPKSVTLNFYNLTCAFWCSFHCCAQEYHFIYVFISTWGSLKIGLLHFFVYSIILNTTHEYFCEVLRTYLSTFQAISAQYLVEYCSSVLAPYLVQIEKSVPGSLFGITRLCWVMLNNDPEVQIFLSAPNNHDRLFFLHTFRYPAFDFNAGVPINE